MISVPGETSYELHVVRLAYGREHADNTEEKGDGQADKERTISSVRTTALKLRKYDKGIADFSKAIKVDP